MPHRLPRKIAPHAIEAIEAMNTTEEIVKAVVDTVTSNNVTNSALTGVKVSSNDGTEIDHDAVKAQLRRNDSVIHKGEVAVKFESSFSREPNEITFIFTRLQPEQPR